MPIERVTRIQPLNQIDKVRRNKSYKIESLPLDKPKVKRNVLGKPMDYIKILIALAVIGLLNGWIGG